MNSIGRKHPTHIGKLPISLAYLDYLFSLPYIRHCEPPPLLLSGEAIPCSTRRLLRREEHPPRNDIPLRDYSLLPRHANRRIAGFDAQLIVDRAQVCIHSAATDDEPLGDLGVAQFFGEQMKHLDFARR